MKQLENSVEIMEDTIADLRAAVTLKQYRKALDCGQAIKATAGQMDALLNRLENEAD